MSRPAQIRGCDQSCNRFVFIETSVVRSRAAATLHCMPSRI